MGWAGLVDMHNNIKYYEPKNKKFSNSRLYDYGGHYTIHKGSEVIDENTGELVTLENDEHFSIPSEAAKFITKNTWEDYSFFETL